MSSQPLGAEDQVQYLLAAEEQILRSIAVRAPIPEILDGICTTLDCQIGSIVSLISVPGDDVASIAAMERNASLFGLHIFFSGNILDDSGLKLGTLEMLCCTAREPSSEELQWIERAACLAAVALKCAAKPNDPSIRRVPKDGAARENAPGWPAFVN